MACWPKFCCGAVCAGPVCETCRFWKLFSNACGACWLTYGFHVFWTCAGAADCACGIALASGSGWVAARFGDCSLISHGFWLAVSSACRVLSIVRPAKPELAIDTGVSALAAGTCADDAALLLSPWPTSASIARSKFPFELLRASEFCLLSLKPISRSVASLASKLLPTLVIFIPNIRLCLLSLTPRGAKASCPDRSLPSKVGERGGVKLRSCLD